MDSPHDWLHVKANSSFWYIDLGFTTTSCQVGVLLNSLQVNLVYSLQRNRSSKFLLMLLCFSHVKNMLPKCRAGLCLLGWRVRHAGWMEIQVPGGKNENTRLSEVDSDLVSALGASLCLGMAFES